MIKTTTEKLPSTWAAEKGNIDAIKVLLNANALTNIKDSWGRVASECGKITAYKMISEHKPGMKYEYVTVDHDEEVGEEKEKKKKKVNSHYSRL